MKSPYFRFIEIDKELIQKFLNKFPEFAQYINVDVPFYVRIYRKPYSGLIHTIIGQDENSQTVNDQWIQLHNYVRRVNAKKIASLDNNILVSIVGEDKAKLIKDITSDVVNNKLNLDLMSQCTEDWIIKTLSKYKGLNLNTIKTFMLFCCFKQNILCDEDEDFKIGLKIFLHKEKITSQDINHIKIKYKDYLTLFSLCMWKIRNERQG